MVKNVIQVSASTARNLHVNQREGAALLDNAHTIESIAILFLGHTVDQSFKLSPMVNIVIQVSGLHGLH